MLEKSEKLNDGLESAAYPLLCTPAHLDNETENTLAG